MKEFGHLTNKTRLEIATNPLMVLDGDQFCQDEQENQTVKKLIQVVRNNQIGEMNVENYEELNEESV